MRRFAELVAGCLLAGGSALAQAPEPPAPAAEPAPEPAAPAPSRRASDRLRGPITVTADRAQWQQEGRMRYSGHVSLSTSGLDLDGDDLQLVQAADGNYQASVAGKPAHLRHAGDGADGPPVAARAQNIVYDSRTAIVELTGGVHLERGTDVLDGGSIRYDVEARRVDALGGGDAGQVRMVIQPPDRDPTRRRQGPGREPGP